MVNQHPEQLARDKIDQKLQEAGWLVRDYRKANLSAGLEWLYGSTQRTLDRWK